MLLGDGLATGGDRQISRGFCCVTNAVQINLRAILLAEHAPYLARCVTGAGQTTLAAFVSELLDAVCANAFGIDCWHATRTPATVTVAARARPTRRRQRSWTAGTRMRVPRLWTTQRLGTWSILQVPAE